LRQLIHERQEREQLAIRREAGQERFGGPPGMTPNQASRAGTRRTCQNTALALRLAAAPRPVASSMLDLGHSDNPAAAACGPFGGTGTRLVWSRFAPTVPRSKSALRACTHSAGRAAGARFRCLPEDRFVALHWVGEIPNFSIL
jgi:hypothetical protein